MNNTKEKILAAALKLFNEFGYSNVTIRMIASDLGISSGNLNYHFSNRIEILEALYFQMELVIDTRMDEAITRPYDIKTLYEGMLASMAIMYKYRFIWADLYFLQKESKRIKDSLKTSIKKEMETWQIIIGKLVTDQFLVDDILSEPNRLFVNRIVDFANNWIFTTALHDYQLDAKELVEQQARYLLHGFYPYMTPKGVNQFNALV